MSFDAALRHVIGPARGAAPAAPAAKPQQSAVVATRAPARSSGGFGALVTVGLSLGLVALLVKGAKEQKSPLDYDAPEPSDGLDEDRTVVETTGEETPCATTVHVVEPLAPPFPVEVQRFAEAAQWGTGYTLPRLPAWVRDPEMWRNAMTSVRPRWQEHSRPWAVVAHVYHAMGGRFA